MLKKIIYILITIVILLAVLLLFDLDYSKPAGVENGGGAQDPFNAIYLIDGRAIKLTDKYFVGEVAPNDKNKIKVSVLGEPVYGDLDKDGDDDALIILAVEIGNSGKIFYYATASLNYPDGWRGTNAVLMGYKVSPQVNQIRNNLAIVNHSVDLEGETTGENPNIGVSDYLYLIGGNLEKANLKNPNIFLIRPQENYNIFSPQEITGYARGNWFFEGEFPIALTNWDGKIIAEGVAKAENDWMVNDFIPFKATLEFKSPYNKGDPAFMRNGSLILHKNNPSDNMGLNEALEIGILF